MAYNISNTAPIVDKQADELSGSQTIKGEKTFTDSVTASAFYDSTTGEQLKSPAIKTIINDTTNSILVSNNHGEVEAHKSLNFTDDTLCSPSFSGNGEKLTNLQFSNIEGTVPANKMNVGPVFADTKGGLSINTGAGITIAENGIQLQCAPNTGILVTESGISCAPTAAVEKRAFSNNDMLLISDSSANHTTKSVTIKNLSAYMQNVLKFTAPTGASGNIQFGDRGRFQSNPSLTFNDNTLRAPNVKVSGDLEVGKNIIDNTQVVLAAPEYNNSQTTHLKENTISFSIDGTDELVVKVACSDGSIKTGTITLK